MNGDREGEKEREIERVGEKRLREKFPEADLFMCR